jgi:hypothetical protein
LNEEDLCLGASGMQLITKIRIAMLVVSAVLIIGGAKSAIEQKLKVIGPVVSENPNGAPYIKMVPATAPRVWGVVRFMAGSALALYVLWPIWKSTGKRA